MKKASPRERFQADESEGGVNRERGEKKLDRLLAAAATLMAKQGYDQTTIRHVGRETGFSLAGMYYYFTSKEDLLFQIQQRTFSSLLDEQEQEVARGETAQEKLELLVRNYLDFYVRNASELKVCTYQLESIKGEQFQEIEKLRRRYFRLAYDVVGELLGNSSSGGRKAGTGKAGPGQSATGRRSFNNTQIRHYTLFIFGMLNWVFLWFDPKRDGPVSNVADEMTQLILNGLPREEAVAGKTRSGRGRTG